MDIDNIVMMSIVRPDGIFVFNEDRYSDEVFNENTGVLEEAAIKWYLETNIQGANRAHDAWCNLQQANAAGQKIAFTTDAGARYFLRSMSTEDLLKEPRTRPVFVELLYRPGLRDEQRREAVTGLATLDKKPELRVVMDAILALDAKQSMTEASVGAGISTRRRSFFRTL